MRASLFSIALSALAGRAVANPHGQKAFSCALGEYFHDRSLYDCYPQCDNSAPTKACCCPCRPGYWCPGNVQGSEDAEEPCPPGTTSLARSTSESSCTGPTPHISQVHVSYTGKPGELSVDFVALSKGAAYAYTSFDNATWARVPAANTFSISTIGHLSQALLQWPGVKAGQTVFYKVGNTEANSTVFPVTPIVARPEVFAVYGDFGAANDVILDTLIADAQAGVFDTVLHVGDWAYNLDSVQSTVGNTFMQVLQPVYATKPVVPAEGNHEACTACPAVPGTAINAGNFSEYQARMWSVALFAGANAGTGTNRYYSFNQGLVHFLVYTAEAYAYKSGKEFIANQLAFMKADLAAVDRSVTPWVVGLVHKAFWMQEDAYADFNAVLNDGGVDIIFAGHVHYYNRLYAYNAATGAIDKGCVSADGSTYTDPNAIVNIISGSPGDREDTSKYVKETYSYTGTENYGYGWFSALNATHATWQFKTVKESGPGPANYADSLTIVQHKHGLRNGGKALFA